MGEPPFAIRAERRLDIVDRIASLIAGSSVSDLEIHDIVGRSVYKLVSDTPRGKTCAHTRGERHVLDIRHQRRLPFEDVDKLILLAMPVQKCRLPARLKSCQITPKFFRLRPKKSPSGRFSSRSCG